MYNMHRTMQSQPSGPPPPPQPSSASSGPPPQAAPPGSSSQPPHHMHSHHSHHGPPPPPPNPTANGHQQHHMQPQSVGHHPHPHSGHPPQQQQQQQQQFGHQGSGMLHPVYHHSRNQSLGGERDARERERERGSDRDHHHHHQRERGGAPGVIGGSAAASSAGPTSSASGPGVMVGPGGPPGMQTFRLERERGGERERERDGGRADLHQREREREMMARELAMRDRDRDRERERERERERDGMRERDGRDVVMRDVAPRDRDREPSGRPHANSIGGPAPPHPSQHPAHPSLGINGPPPPPPGMMISGPGVAPGVPHPSHHAPPASANVVGPGVSASSGAGSNAAMVNGIGGPSSTSMPNGLGMGGPGVPPPSGGPGVAIGAGLSAPVTIATSNPVVASAGGPAGVSGGMPTIAQRLAENFDVVRQEFEILNSELSLVRGQRDEFEAKVQSQVNELNIIRRSLYDLESQHGKVRQQFEEELAKVRAELNVARQQVAAAQAGGPPPPGAPGAPPTGPGGNISNPSANPGGNAGSNNSGTNGLNGRDDPRIGGIAGLGLGDYTNVNAQVNDSIFYTGGRERERDRDREGGVPSMLTRDLAMPAGMRSERERERERNESHRSERERVERERERVGLLGGLSSLGERDGPLGMGRESHRERERREREREQRENEMLREREREMEREREQWGAHMNDRDRERAEREKDRLADSRDPKRLKGNMGEGSSQLGVLGGPGSASSSALPLSRRERDRERELREREAGVGVVAVAGGVSSSPSMNTSAAAIGPTPKLPPVPGTTNTGSAAVAAAQAAAAAQAQAQGQSQSDSQALALRGSMGASGPGSGDAFPEGYELYSLPPEYKKEGPDWFAMYNPKMRRAVEVELMHTLMHESVVCCVRFSADGKYLATGCNRTAQIYDTKTGVKTCVLMDENAVKQGDLYIRSVCFSPDGKYLATGAEDKVIRIWDIERKRIRTLFDGHQQEIYSLEFSLDGRLIVSGSGDKTARVWDLANNECVVLTITDSASTIDSSGVKGEGDGMDVDEAGDSSGGGGGNGAGGSAAGGAVAAAAATPDAGVTSVAISPDGRYVAAGSLDKVVRIWELIPLTGGIFTRTSALVERLQGHRDSVYSVAFTPDGKGLVSGSLDRTIKYWDVSHLGIIPHTPSAVPPPTAKLGDPPLPVSKPPSSSSSSSSSPNKKNSGRPGSRGGQQGFVGLAKCTATFAGHKDYVLSVAVSGDGQWVVSGSKDRAVQFWELGGSDGREKERERALVPAGSGGSCACVLQGHKNSVISIDLSTVGNLLATGSGDWQARIWSYKQASP